MKFGFSTAESISVDGSVLLSTHNSLKTETEFTWEPNALGSHDVVYASSANCWTQTVYVSALSFFDQPAPNPPTSKVANISITPVTREIPQTGGGAAINTSGSGAWTAAVSDDWISLNATSGAAGKPVAYVVGANANVEDRVGYVYVAGYTHTVTQKGLGATVDKTNIEVERDGGTGTVTITPTNTRSSWKARPNCDWISISPTSGMGPTTVTYRVAPWHEVSTRSGTFTVGGHTVTVFQYGSRMALDTYSATRDYYAHVISVKVDALAVTSWTVKPNASWISVVDAGNGQGGDMVSIAISENPSYRARTGTVTIGTETFTVTQEGRTALSFAISPAQTTAAVSGANGLVSVTATPDLPWTAKSGANWITVLANFQKGAGNGNVVYTVSPQSTLYARTGKITITPEKASKMPAQTHTVKQPAATSALSATGHEFAAAGETASVEVTVNDIVEWKVANLPDWITLSGSASRVGPGTVTLAAAANETVYPRAATVKIAEKAFKVSQRARGVEVEYDNKLFGTDGGMESISIHPDGNVAWKAVASADWIVIYQNDSGTGDAEIFYIIAPYTGDGSPRTGTITVGDKVVYITQRAYDLDITPKGDWVTGNAGAGEIGVSASIGDVWSAIVTEPWITIVTGYDAGTGSGTVRFTYTDNETGKTRTGKIIIAGEVYTLTQAARVRVTITAEVSGGGHVSGAGTYTLGEQATLTAVPDDGHEFLYWTDDAGETMQNPLVLTADVAKRVTAHFGPLTPEFTNTESSIEGVRLMWRNLAWATQYKIYRAPTNESSTKELATLVADGTCTYLDTTGEIGKTYFYWVEAIGVTDRTESKNAASGMKRKPIVHSSITYANLKGATNPNPGEYEEGKALAFANPGAVTGYTFMGWTPAMITAEMTGTQTVRANWKANTYRIVYDANGGSGTAEATDCTYDTEGEIAANGFVRVGYVFKGWAVEEGGAVVYAPGTKVMNLVSNAGGVVTLYAVWEAENARLLPVITPADGSVFKTASCTVTITCAVEDALIYYTTNGRTPRPTEANHYKGPFVITDTTTVLAYAVRDGMESDLAEATITYVEPAPLTLETALDEPKFVQMSTGGDANWIPVEEASARVGEAAAKSGSIGMDAASWLEATVHGKGTLMFWWKVSCEPDPRGRYTYDHVTFTADGEDVFRLDGEKNWERKSFTFTTDGPHTVRWTYSSDDWEEPGFADCAWLDGVSWVESSEPPRVSEIVYENLKGAAHANPVTYEEGTKVVFSEPDTVRGYTFTGWTPAMITAEMTGTQTVRANWKANTYRITYDANGGSGVMASTDCTYDVEVEIAANAFVRENYVFQGWATRKDGVVAYVPGTKVTNLTSQAGGVVMLYAVWEDEESVALMEALDEPKLAMVKADGDWHSVHDEKAKTGETVVTCRQAYDYAHGASSYLETTVYGKGTFTFWWRISSVYMGTTSKYFSSEFAREARLTVLADGVTKACHASPAPDENQDCEQNPVVDESWQEQSIAFETEGKHVVRWVFDVGMELDVGLWSHDAWVDGVVWTGEKLPSVPSAPLITGDADAAVTGDAESGFTVRPSAETEIVEVVVPDGLDPAKVTVAVTPGVKTVRANGAVIKVMRGAHDITPYLDIPKAVAGSVDLTQASVKEEVVLEVLDTTKGARIELNAAAPSLTTTPTKKGLVYRLKEGATLGEMVADADGDSKVGDGAPWTPKVTVKGGASGFYSIRVSK